MHRLRRSLSGVLGGKKANSTTPSSLRGIPEDDIAIPHSPPFHHDEIVYGGQLQQAVVDSLRDRSHALEQERNSATIRVRHLEEQLSIKAAEQDTMQRTAGRLQQDNTRIREREASRQRDYKEIVDGFREEKRTAEGKHAKAIAELEQNVKEYQVYCVKLDGTQQELQEKIHLLESENETLLKSPECAVAEIQEERAKLRKRIEALEAERSHDRSVREAGNRAHHGLQKRLVGTNKQNAELSEQVAALHQEIEVLKAGFSRNMAQQLEEQQQRHERDQEEASQVLGTALTPRAILVHKMLSQNSHNFTVSGNGPNATAFLQSCSPAMLTNHLLDIQLSTQQAKRFSANANINDHQLILCDLCQHPKFARKSNVNSRLRINEFTRPPTGCCSKSICTECFRGNIVNSLASDWYDQILSFRAALKRLDPIPDENAMKIARNLHRQLITVGRMHSLFDPMFANTEPDYRGRIPPFMPGKISLISVDHEGASIQVPLFMRFLSRLKRPTECAYCAEEFYDINFGSMTEWLDLCTGFHGDWMWKILQFPVKLGLECRHDIDFCTGCLGKHLESQLNQFGRSKCDQLACPAHGCGRLLAYQEIKLYAEPETFDKYDRYLNLNTLSRYPNFRWCLGPGCSSGQIYDDGDDEEFVDTRVHCQDCAFEMCLHHSMPWHEGQTCEQFDSMRQHGDPDFQQTQDWIRQNTKPCPNCRENIEKGEACFHMTCRGLNLFTPPPPAVNSSSRQCFCLSFFVILVSCVLHILRLRTNNCFVMDPPEQTSLASLVHLPLEILQVILSELPNCDLKSLRRMYTHLSRVVELHFSRVFLSTSPRDANISRAVADHKRFRKNFVEIVYDDARFAHEMHSTDGSYQIDDNAALRHYERQEYQELDDLSASGIPAWYRRIYRYNSLTIDQYGCEDVKRLRHYEVIKRFKTRTNVTESCRLYQMLLREQD
ncbi:hypothetical protein G7Z17_g505 [Cylindrodendrum hubeiense]|uniref:RBR-type E3 ubiquitin transferase n=1 Tax=Cylindrodendrum hubeiense TaxID=595255 RepID=A0A9P5HHT2_9HYPO|nr:hypothetical protein G7Z17_g505 [Cylindrodendrum hubeiense]